MSGRGEKETAEYDEGLEDDGRTSKGILKHRSTEKENRRTKEKEKRSQRRRRKRRREKNDVEEEFTRCEVMRGKHSSASAHFNTWNEIKERSLSRRILRKNEGKKARERNYGSLVSRARRRDGAFQPACMWFSLKM